MKLFFILLKLFLYTQIYCFDHVIKTIMKYPTDLKFHPNDKSLWVTDQDKDLFWIFPYINNSIINYPTTRRDRAPYHYMANVSGLAFTENGNLATSQESINEYLDWYRNTNTEPNYFMGPTLFNISENALITTDGEKCILNGERDCFLIHTDMLHEAPMSTGIIYNKKWESDPHKSYKQGPNSFWYIDGLCKMLIMYDFDTPHGPFSMDHSTARVHRYENVRINVVNRVITGMAITNDRTLLISDSEKNRILEVDIDKSIRLGDARENYNIYSSANNKSFDYALYNAPYRVFGIIDKPTGLTEHNNIIYAIEYNTGNIKRWYKNGSSLDTVINKKKQQKGWANIIIKDYKLYAINSLDSTININENILKYSTDINKCYECGINCYLCNDKQNCLYNRECKSNSCINNFCSGNNIELDIDSKNLSSQCVKIAPNTPVVRPEPDDYIPEPGYEDPQSAIENRNIMKIEEDCSTLNLDALLLSGFLCHKCLPNPCYNGAKCINIINKGFKCDCGKINMKGDLCEFKNSTNSPINKMIDSKQNLKTNSPIKKKNNYTTTNILPVNDIISKNKYKSNNSISYKNNIFSKILISSILFLVLILII